MQIYTFKNMTNEELIKINQISHKFGHLLIDQGIKFIRTAYKLNPKVFTRSLILEFLKDRTGLLSNTISLADEKYYVESWGKWGQIIDYDLIDQQIYHYDYFDCDNSAFLYASRAGLIYGLNSCGVCFGSVHKPITKELIGYHAFNLILAHENGALKAYLYEPMTDSAVEWRKGQDNILQVPADWLYRINWLIYY